MAKALSPLKLHRKNCGKIERIVDISNLIEMQKESYRRFLQKDVPAEGGGHGEKGKGERESAGIGDSGLFAFYPFRLFTR